MVTSRICWKSNGDSKSSSQVSILDGSTGYVLLRNGLPEDDTFSKIWSAAAFVDPKYHELVVFTHKQYLEVGSTAITTNSYAVQPTYYEKAYGETYAEKMIEHAELSAKLAVQAREEYLKEHPCSNGAKIKVMGSMPPLVESHRPDIFKKALAEKGEEFFKRSYKQLAGALLKGGADVLLFETLNCWEEGRLGLEAMLEFGLKDVPLYVSFEGSIRDEALVPQPHLAPELCEKVLQYKDKGLPIEVIGWNCAPPEDIEKNFEVLESTGMLKRVKDRGLSFAVYANLNERKVYDEGFDVENIETVATDGKPVTPKSTIKARTDMTGGSEDDPFAGYVAFTHRLITKHGVSAVGGCCGCGPLGIEAVCKDCEAI
eukprot:TRINITY_DN27440_c0_g1_i1.p1 TRINITY_DN27440_c0_g1~~TRINITY_DN27440_c0_g1_i1.p1  ORF type:complete len:436 (+),score=103.69 TRINITY_DN27440_c0_g1_i1:195-1310(+)